MNFCGGGLFSATPSGINALQVSAHADIYEFQTMAVGMGQINGLLEFSSRLPLLKVTILAVLGSFAMSTVQGAF